MHGWRSTRGSQAGVMLAGALGLAWGTAAPAWAQGLPQHIVAYMTGAGQTQCPDNWTEAAYAQGRVILGTTNGAEVQNLAGTPAGDAQLPQHVHAFKVSGTAATEQNSTLPSGSIPRAGGGEAVSTGTTQDASVALPFIQFLVCEQMVAESPDTAPYGTVAFFNAAACPEGWAALDQAEGRFLVPAFAGAAPGYATSTFWDPTDPPTHTHSLEATAGTQSAAYESWPANFATFASPGEHTVTGTSASAGPVLPFVSLLVCEKDAIGNSEGIPPGTMVFFGAEDCPDDWGVTIGAGGRFVVGIGGNGTQGATFGSDPIGSGATSVQHDHAFSGEVSLPASGHPGGPKRPDYGFQSYVTTAGNGYSGTSGKATSEVPYLVLQSCTFNDDAGRKATRG